MLFSEVKLAHVLPWISRNAGGLFHSVSGLAKASAGFPGVQVQIFGSRDEFSDEDRRQWDPLTVRTAVVKGPGRLCYTPQLRGMIEDFAPDLIHSAAVWTYQAAVVNQVHARKETPYVLSPRGTLDPWALRNSRWKKRIALWWYQQEHFQNAACLHALNESELASIRAFGLKNPVCVIPNGIDLPTVGNADPPPSDISASQLVSFSDSSPSSSPFQLSGRRILLYLGRIHPKKGLVNLLRAWAQLRTSHLALRTSEDWVLAIAGWDEGGHESELKQLATELGIPWADSKGKAEILKTEMLKGSGQTNGDDFSVSAYQRLSISASQPVSLSGSQRFSLLFLGPQFGDAKAACYRTCDAFILPSFSEGLPMVVLEAWAYGKPVLMTPQCNLPEGFSANAALRIEPNPESITAGLRELFRQPATGICQLGLNGRKLVEEKFAWPAIASEMKSVYDWVLGGGPKPGCVD